jgi:hypothetical protein
MSGVELEAGHESRLVRVYRTVLISGMMGCIVLSLVGLVQRVVPYWPGQYLALFAFLVCVEGIVSSRLLEEHVAEHSSRLQIRVAEWVIIASLLRLLVSLLGGWVALLSDVIRWLGNPFAMFDDVYMITSIVLFLVWQTGIYMAKDLRVLGAEPVHEQSPPITSDEYWIWVSRPRGSVDSEAALRHLSSTFVWGGVLLLVFAGLSRVDIELMVGMRHPPTPGIVLNVLLYFLLGLALLSQAQYATLQSRWKAEEIEVGPRIGRRWATLAIAFVSAVALVAVLLPTGYSVGLLNGLRYALRRILEPVLGFFMSIVSAFMAVVGRILQLLLGRDLATYPERAPSMPSRPQAIPSPAAAGVAWWDVVRSVFFWGLIAWILVYSFRHYFRGRRASWRGLLRFRALRWLVGVWRSLFRGSARLVQRARGGLRDVLRQIGLGARRAGAPLRFLSLRSLSPRELVRYFYLSIVRRATQVGWGRRPSQTPYEYKSTLAEQLPESGSDVDDLTQAFVEARYSAREFSIEETGLLKEVWRRIKGALQRANRFLRRDKES